MKIVDGNSKLKKNTHKHFSKHEKMSIIEKIMYDNNSFITENVSEELKTELTGEGRTILQIPEDLLPMFMTKKDPIKLGKVVSFLHIFMT